MVMLPPAPPRIGGNSAVVAQLDVSREQVNISPGTRYTRAVNGGFGVEGDRIGDNIDAASRPPSQTLDANHCAVSDTQSARRNAQASRRTKCRLQPEKIQGQICRTCDDATGKEAVSGSPGYFHGFGGRDSHISTLSRTQS